MTISRTRSRATSSGSLPANHDAHGTELDRDRPHYRPHPPPPPTVQQQQTISGKVKGMGGWLKDYGTALKHGSIRPYTLTERKTRAATRNQPWGPVGSQLNELAELSYSPGDCNTIFMVLNRRLDYPPTKWRNVYKSLSVLEFLIKRGSEDAVVRARTLVPKLESLQGFAYITPDSRDVGANVRHRALAIKSLLSDERRLKNERRAGEAQRQRQERDKSSPWYHESNYSQRVEAEINRDSSSNSGGEDGDDGNIVGKTIATTDESANDVHNGNKTQLRKAGETKGVDPEANARHLAALKRLLARPENLMCADCAIPGAGHRPTWASISLGVFICMRCAGVHRGLGVHVSQVRSCSLDAWRAEQVEFMAACGGNKRANAYWEARLEDGKNGRPRVDTLAHLDAFVRRKYVDKEFVDEGEESNDASGSPLWPPRPPYTFDAPTLLILDEMMSDEERASWTAAREEEEEEKKKAALAAGERAKAELQVGDLISLLDVVTPVPIAAPVKPADHSRDNDPFAALHGVFTGDGGKGGRSPEDPLGLSGPGDGLDSWDIAKALKTETAKFVKEENKDVEREQVPVKSAKEMKGQGTPSSYHPPWAPSPSSSPVVDSLSHNHHQASSSLNFDKGFSSVPHQFTSSPVVTAADHRLVLVERHGVGQSSGTASGTALMGTKPTEKGKEKVTTQAKTQAKGKKVLLPHELRAQQLLMGGLDSLTAHANLVTVNSPSSIQSPTRSLSPSTSASASASISLRDMKGR